MPVLKFNMCLLCVQANLRRREDCGGREEVEAGLSSFLFLHREGWVIRHATVTGCQS